MKIAFINPPVKDYSALDLGLTYLATYINVRTLHQASIVDLVFHRRNWREYLRRELAAMRPDWVGLSTNKLYLAHSKEVADECHRMGYGVVLGGHQASVDPEGTMQALGANAVCTGDGETSLIPAMDIMFRQSNMQGEYDPIFRGSFLSDLNALPLPNYALWKDLDKYIYFLGSLYTIGSRGCPYTCRFCDAHGVQHAVGGQYFRSMSPGSYAFDLAALDCQYHPPLFQAFDPVFTMYPEWVEQFGETYQKLGTKVPFSVFSRIDHLDERRIKALAAANCRIVRVGIEAGDERIRNEVYGKKVSDEQVRTAVRLCKQYGIRITAYWILGGPSETNATVKRTIRMARELDCERTVFFIYKVITSEGASQMQQAGATFHLDRADNISFGSQCDQPGLSGRRVELYQAEGYAWTFSRRLLRLIRAQKAGYATRLLQYMARGLACGLDPKYLLMYSQVYNGPNALM